jgi:hypothetical protein
MIKADWVRWVEHVACIRLMPNAYILLIGTPEGNSSLGRPRRRWLDNVRMDLEEIGCMEDVD